MRELSLNILDIACNSVKAGARNIAITVSASSSEDFLLISIEDDGHGMDEELLKRVTDPFATTRTTRPVGMGIPLFKEAAACTGGTLEITSRVGEGTLVKATFGLSHIDRMPLGDLAETIIQLVNMSPSTDYSLSYCVNGKSYYFETAAARQELDGLPINLPEVLSFLGTMLRENITETNGGTII